MLKNIFMMIMCFLCSYSFAIGATTQEKIDQITKMLDQRNPGVTQESIINHLGPPDKLQIFMGASYLIYETEKKDYVFVVIVHEGQAACKKVPADDPQLKNLFQIKTDAKGIPVDEKGQQLLLKNEESMSQRKEGEPSGDYNYSEDAYFKISPESYHSLGIMTPDRNKRLEYLNKAIEIDNRYGKAYISRGLCNADLGSCQEAVNDFEKALEIMPKQTVIYSYISWVLSTRPDARFRDGKRAIESAERAIALDKRRDDNIYENNNKADF